MNPGAGKRRRYRIRRRRRPEESGYRGEPDVPVEVAEFGCCVIEAVTSLSIILGLVLVPALFYLS